MPGVSINVGWYRRSFSNILTRGGNYRRQVFVNRERDIQNDYRGIDVVSPFNGEVFTVYDLKDPAELAFEDNFYTNAPESRRVYNGYEASLNARLPGGGTLITSVTTQAHAHPGVRPGRRPERIAVLRSVQSAVALRPRRLQERFQGRRLLAAAVRHADKRGLQQRGRQACRRRPAGGRAPAHLLGHLAEHAVHRLSRRGVVHAGGSGDSRHGGIVHRGAVGSGRGRTKPPAPEHAQPQLPEDRPGPATWS